MKVEATKIQKYEIDVDPVQVFNQIFQVLYGKIEDGVRKERFEGFVPRYDSVYLQGGMWYGVVDMCGRGRDIEEVIRGATEMEKAQLKALKEVEKMVNDHVW